MSLPQSFLDELRARVGLAALIGRRVRLQRRGREFQGLCPFHNEKTPSFTVNEDKGFFHCFGCGAHGDQISFVMQAEGLSFPDAVERLAAEAGLAVPQPTPEAKAQADRQASLLEVVEAAAEVFATALESAEGQAARAYLDERDVSEASRQRFRLGFAPARRGFLTQALSARGIAPAQMVEAGLAKRDEDGGRLREYFFGRVIFPIADRRGRILGFGGRRLGEEGPKYLNSPDGTLFHKGTLLYNLGAAAEGLRAGAEALLVVEGYMDVIALTQSGFAAAVAPLGTALTENQLQLAWRFTEEPLLCFDGDAAGRRAALRVVERALPLLQPGKSLSFAFLSEGEDPDSLLRKRGRDGLKEVLAQRQPLAELVWAQAAGDGLPATPERWAALKYWLLETARQVAEPSVQESYRGYLLDRYYAARRQGRSPTGSLPTRGKRGGPPERQAPNLVKPDPAGRRRQAESELLAIVLNQPQLAVRYDEELVRAELGAADLNAFKVAVLDCLAAHPELDSTTLRRQVCALGYVALVENILSSAVYSLCSAAQPGATEDQAERTLVSLLADFAEQRALRAVQEAELRFAADPNDRTLALLDAARQDCEAASRRRTSSTQAEEGARH